MDNVENEFYRGVQADYSDVVENVEGASFVSWAMGLARSGRPTHRVVEFDGQPYLELFDGYVVAVDLDTAEGVTRRAWLPVLDTKNRPVPRGLMNVRDLSDALKRALAKAIAMGTGHTLSYYSRGLHAAEFVDAVGVWPQDDLAVVKPKVAEKRDKAGRLKATYLGWPEAVAAASITDASFRWEVLFFEVPDPVTGEVVQRPYRHGPAGGFLVSVAISYKGRKHIEVFPILGIDTVQTKNGPKAMEHRPNLSPTVADWNASVMRALAKGIAIATGYGLSIYAGEDIERLVAGGIFTAAPSVSVAAPAPAPAPAPAEVAATVASSDEDQLRTKLIEDIHALVKITDTKLEPLLSHFQAKGEFEDMPSGLLVTIQEALVAKRRRQEATRSAA